ncbi:OPA3 domain protein [Cordyceps militaris CM01]|uniref:OPA3 domain protein n=1 Tax=Cordyceps militaris (strain CM01) TaxID=983644 RepID=G3JLH7_CORMM|nr:OPA3 domain protein [Cordyceps militaris CM01]EGX90551.1 OPA3 domain protein [Cordyceps militaris CM01]
MVPLPLFKLGSLFLRHISKYGANRIKKQAHDHARFRAFAARYGQMMHQLNMRTSVALLRDPEAERRAREKAEAPTVKTEAQTRREEEGKAKEQQKASPAAATTATATATTKQKTTPRRQPFQNIWTRKFRALPEDKAVDLFADVVGDTFILGVAVALILYEYWRSQQKPDSNKEQIEALGKRLDERDGALREAEARLGAVEEALRALRDAGPKKAVQASLGEAAPT